MKESVSYVIVKCRNVQSQDLLFPFLVADDRKENAKDAKERKPDTYYEEFVPFFY